MKIVVGGIEKRQGDYSSSEIFVSYELNDNDFNSSDEQLSQMFNSKIKKMLFDRFKVVYSELYRNGKISDEEMIKKIANYIKKDERTTLLLESNNFMKYLENTRKEKKHGNK